MQLIIKWLGKNVKKGHIKAGPLFKKGYDLGGRREEGRGGEYEKFYLLNYFFSNPNN